MRITQALACLAFCCSVGTALGQEPIPALRSAGPATQPAPDLATPSPGWAEPAPSDSGLRVRAEADYVLYWLKAVCLKPLTLSVGPTGVLSDPGNVVVQGGHKFQFEGASGLRPRLGAWLADEPSLGVEAEGFVLERVSATQNFRTSNGSPATWIVFENPDNSQGALPFSVPGVVNASSTATGSTQLWGVETNLSVRLPLEGSTWHATLLLGARYLHGEDRVVLTNTQVLLANPAVQALGQADFATHNQFIGPQIGARVGVTRGPLTLDLTFKVAFGESLLASDVSGGALLAGQSVLPPAVPVPGPVLALPTNLGHQSSERVAVVPEVNLKLQYRVGESMYLTLGYNLLYWNKVLCPGDQMDSHVNISQLPFRGPFVGARDPAPQFVFTDVFAHGLEAGVGFDY